MRLLAILFLIFGVALAGGAIYYAMQHFEAMRASLADQEEAPPETAMVVAAKRPLKLGDQLTYELAKEYLKFVEWPKEAVPPSAFTTADELFGKDKKEVRTVTRSIEPGELVLKSKITGFGESRRIVANVREGMRAVTIPINALTGQAGLIAPGDFVDILFIRKTGEQVSSHVLLQKIKVVATDQSTDAERSSVGVARTATVEVTPSDAHKLTIAMQAGTLSLLLRGINEEVLSGEDLKSFDTSLLPGGPVQPEPEPEPEKVEPAPEPEDNSYGVRVRKGVEVQEHRFE